MPKDMSFRKKDKQKNAEAFIDGADKPTPKNLKEEESEPDLLPWEEPGFEGKKLKSVCFQMPRELVEKMNYLSEKTLISKTNLYRKFVKEGIDSMLDDENG